MLRSALTPKFLVPVCNILDPDTINVLFEVLAKESINEYSPVDGFLANFVIASIDPPVIPFKSFDM